jgi:polyisoprenyl-phosphate glycosyltransferase
MGDALLPGSCEVAVSSDFRLSVAIPVFNEEEVFPALFQRVSAVLDSIAGGPHEIVFVDDGSTDGTAELLVKAAADPRVVAISLSRNFGHQAALTAALDHVSGDATILMDADLQDEPEMIPVFVKHFLSGYDVVYAQRIERKESAFLRFFYYAYYRLAAGLSGTQLPVDAGDFGLLSRRVVLVLRGMPERHRYLRGLRAWAGFRQIGVPVARARRNAGDSKYGVGQLLRLAFDGIFAFSVVPLRAAAFLGMLAISIASLFGAYALVARIFFEQSPRGFTALILTLIFLSGVQLLFLGIIGEYLGRLYEEAKGRPLYVVADVRRASERAAPINDSRSADPDCPPDGNHAPRTSRS